MSLKVSCFLFVTLIASALTLAIFKPDNSTNGEPSAKFLSLFSVVRFPNSLCLGSNGYNGTCLTSDECKAKAGAASGSCASGFGVCCTVKISTCGGSVPINNTYWTNPNYPLSYKVPGQCSISIRTGTNSNICQLRLDFVDFALANPDQTAGTATQCLVDLFTVSGESNEVPGLCGTFTNQHMYLDITPSNDLYVLNMILSGTSTSRLWNIRIAQIPCGTTYTAPYGCLQWFTDAVGTIQSFNYQFATTPTVQHLANQDYTICIRTNQGFCGICYQVCDAPTALTKPFLLSTEAATTILDTACLTDFIQIPCAVDQQSAAQTLSGGTVGCASKICGAYFSAVTGAAANAPVYSYRTPFEVRVYTDSYDATTAGGLGFCLKYQQQPCNVNSG